MNKFDMIRAWKDEDYFGNLSEADRQIIPNNPGGVITLTDEEIAGIEGGTTGTTITTITTVFITFITMITCGITLCSYGVEDRSNR